MTTTVMRTSIRAEMLEGAAWDDVALEDVSEHRLVSDSASLIWIDIAGSPEEIRSALADLLSRCPELGNIDPRRATEGGESPPRRPPKAKAFRDAVFTRAYWMQTPDAIAQDRVWAQEVHILAGPTFAITMRYPLQIWDMGKMEWSSETPEVGDAEVGFSTAKLKHGVTELRDRFARDTSTEAFGLEVAAAALDQIVDSVFDALNGLRLRAEALEAEIVDPSWLSRANGNSDRALPERTLGLRRLLRQIRWAFLPSDEISELLSGPFLELRDRGIRVRFDDLGREADRAIATVRDVTEQVQQTVELSNTMKTDRLNDTIHDLTVVATVLLVPTLIAGILGMNFVDIPGASWRWGFWSALAVMAGVGVVVWFGVHAYLNRRQA